MSPSVELTCTSCGGPRNHFVDGKLRPRCTSCNDRATGRAKVKPRKSAGGATVYRSKSEPTPPSKAAVELLERIDEMLEDERYEWAENTLSGIRETVERTGAVTENQARAITNIEDAGERRGGR